MTAMRSMMAKLKLTVNESKTRLCHGPDEAFDFLGYTIGRCYWWRTGRPYIGARLSAKKLQALNRKLSEQTGRSWQWLEPGEMVARLNHLLRGWVNYFCLGTVTNAYRKVMAHACYRFRRWLTRKQGERGLLYSRFNDRYLHDELGLLRLQRRPRLAGSSASA